jgi:hypothetical protein
MPLDIEGQYLRLRLTGSEKSFPTLLDVTSFLYDVNLLYEFRRLSIDPEHQGFVFSQYAYYRNRRPLEDFERLHVESLKLSSPFEVSTVVAVVGGAIGAVGGLVVIVQTTLNASLNRRKLAAEVKKLERENEAQAIPNDVRFFEDVETVRRVLRVRESESFVNSVEQRLTASPMRVKELEVEVVSSRTLRHEHREESSDDER